jgi:hypothetical protein
MTRGETDVRTQWTGTLVILLFVLCGIYSGYRAVHLAITNDETATLDSARQTGYTQLLLGKDWNSQAHFLNALLVKLCAGNLPLNDLVASRLPSLLGLGLFLWGVWRIGAGFPTGATRLLVTLALLSNAFLLDFFGIARGYGLALGFTVLSLSFLLDSQPKQQEERGGGQKSAAGAAAIALWLAFGAALSNLGFVYFYGAVLVALAYWQKMPKFQWWVSALFLGGFCGHRASLARGQNQLYFGGEEGFVHDTVGSLVRCSFYDKAVSTGLVLGVSVGLTFLVLFLAYWSHRERIHSAFALSLIAILLPAFYYVARVHRNVKFPEERAVLYLVPLVVLIVALVAARTRHRYLRFFLSGLLLAYAGIGLANVNLNHTLTWRDDADIPSMLLSLRQIHERTGETVFLACSDNVKWALWYYAENDLRLQASPETTNGVYLKKYDWVTFYEWRGCQVAIGSPPTEPFLPGTTHLLLDPNDTRVLADSVAGQFTQTRFFPASSWRLYARSGRDTESVASGGNNGNKQ